MHTSLRSPAALALALLFGTLGCGESAAPVADGGLDASRDGAVTADADVTPADVAVDTTPARPPPTLGLNDVSVLFPSPATQEAPGYLRPTDMAAHGVLLPRAVFDRIPGFPVVPADAIAYDRMRVLSLRVDGCGGPHTSCYPQIRLVMQPMRTNLARDSALHLFYRLTPAEMDDVVQSLRRMRALAPGLTDGPLEVNRALTTQGIDGAWGTALRELVLRHLGEERLQRVTFFLRAPPATEVWFFGGLERNAMNAFEAMTIVGVGMGNQRVIHTEEEAGFRYDFTPVGTTPENHTPVLSAATSAMATEERRRAAVASLYRVENPLRYVPDELPCAGCHVSTYVLGEAARTHGLVAEQFATERYTNARFDLTVRGTAGEQASSLRAFGWFNSEPMISQRTVNETAAVIEDLDTRHPPR